MAEAVYVLCAVTSAVCAVLLFRSYRRNKVRLLFWSTFCFSALALNNVVLFIDLVMTSPQTDLMAVRGLVAVVGLAALLVSFIWDAG